MDSRLLASMHRVTRLSIRLFTCTLRSHDWRKSESSNYPKCQRCGREIVPGTLNVRTGDAEDNFITDRHYTAWAIRGLVNPEFWLKVFSLKVAAPATILVLAVATIALLVTFLINVPLVVALVTLCLIVAVIVWRQRLAREFGTGFLQSIQELHSLWQQVRVWLRVAFPDVVASLIGLVFLSAVLFGAISAGLAVLWSEPIQTALHSPIDRPVQTAPYLKLASWVMLAVLASMLLVREALHFVWPSRIGHQFRSGDMPNYPTLPWIARIAHLSDLHVVGERYGVRMEAGANGPRGNACCDALFEHLTSIQGKAPVDHVFITGDVTDSGRSSEWGEFLDILNKHPKIKDKILFVPGNHDLNICDRNNPSRADLAFSWGRAMRQVRMLKAMSEVQGERVNLVTAEGTCGESLNQYLSRPNVAMSIDAYSSCLPEAGAKSMGEIWEEIFPLCVFPTKRQSYGIILLDSNTHSSFSFTNALGSLSSTQEQKLQRIIDNDIWHTYIILLHHHITEVGGRGTKLAEKLGTVMQNADRLLMPLLNNPVATSIIMHGHRHVDWFGSPNETDRISVVSAPSSTFASIDTAEPSFHCFDLVGTPGNMRLSKYVA